MSSTVDSSEGGRLRQNLDTGFGLAAVLTALNIAAAFLDR